MMTSDPNANPVAHTKQSQLSSNNNTSSNESKSPNQNKQVIKVVILGNAGVGKTALLNRFVDDNYTNNYKATIGTDMRSKQITINNETVTLQLWDTAGQERFNSLSDQFHRGAQMCLLVFDITDSKSFESLSHWRDTFLAATNLNNSNSNNIDESEFPFACIGNKVDLQNKRAVSQRRAIAWCNYISGGSNTTSTNVTNSSLNNDSTMPYYETSAKDSTNVTLAFMELARKAYANSKKQHQQIANALYNNRSGLVKPSNAPVNKVNESGCCG